MHAEYPDHRSRGGSGDMRGHTHTQTQDEDLLYRLKIFESIEKI